MADNISVDNEILPWPLNSRAQRLSWSPNHVILRVETSPGVETTNAPDGEIGGQAVTKWSFTFTAKGPAFIRVHWNHGAIVETHYTIE